MLKVGNATRLGKATRGNRARSEQGSSQIWSGKNRNSRHRAAAGHGCPQQPKQGTEGTAGHTGCSHSNAAQNAGPNLLLSCTTCENACTPAGVHACVCACLCMGVSARARVCMCVCTRMGVRGCARMCACRCRWVCMRVFMQEASRRGWRMVVPWLRVHRAQGATECLIHAAGQRWLQQKRCWMHQKQHWVQQGWQ